MVETADCCYLVEVKGENKLTDPDVLDKKKRGIQYCDVSTRWYKANGYKPVSYTHLVPAFDEVGEGVIALPSGFPTAPVFADRFSPFCCPAVLFCIPAPVMLK